MSNYPVVMTGLPDDSVSGEEIVIAMAQDEQGWAVTEVFKRWICVRSENAGRWTDQKCT